MPYSLKIKPPERHRREDEEDGDSTGRRRRFSLSTPSELARSSIRIPRGASFSDDAIPTEPGSPKLVLTPSLSTSRVERLLRERQLRRSGSCFQFGDPGPEFEENAISEQLRPDSRNSSYGDISATLEHSPQRLLVVANRLPVSAIAKPDGSWSLELSAGGLVSALLGEKCRLNVMFRASPTKKNYLCISYEFLHRQPIR